MHKPLTEAQDKVAQLTQSVQSEKDARSVLENSICLKNKTHTKDNNTIMDICSQLTHSQQNDTAVEAKVVKLTAELMSTKVIARKAQKVETSLKTQVRICVYSSRTRLRCAT